jgi:hypothetical protein
MVTVPNPKEAIGRFFITLNYGDYPGRYGRIFTVYNTTQHNQYANIG